MALLRTIEGTYVDSEQAEYLGLLIPRCHFCKRNISSLRRSELEPDRFYCGEMDWCVKEDEGWSFYDGRVHPWE